MMPLALGLLALELWVLSKLLVPRRDEEPAAFHLAGLIAGPAASANPRARVGAV
jgi:hypothetical protein